MFKKFAKEFKEFALQGNVVDMAIGVIIGAAFKDIVTSFTDNFINPLIASIGGDWDVRVSDALKGKLVLRTSFVFNDKDELKCKLDGIVTSLASEHTSMLLANMDKVTAAVEKLVNDNH